MSRTGSEIHRSQRQSKVVQDRITEIENHLSQLCDTSSSYTRKTARLRDKGDLLAKQLMEYAEYEKWNPSLSSGMLKFAENVSAVQDYREAQVKRLEGKIISPLMHYGLLCKQTKNDLKSSFAAIERELVQKKKLETTKAKTPTDRSKILENDLQKASIESSRSSKSLEQQVDKFEEQKLKDLKKIMREFVMIEMHFHAKALELYTQCFQTLDSVDPDTDLEEFRHQLRPNGSIRSDIARSASQASLESKQNSTGSSTPRPKPPPQKQATPADTRKRIVPPAPAELEDDSEEEDDDDEDDESEEESDEDYTETEKTEPQPKKR
ncbi:protein fam92a1 [Plakobranchus ocellatus]|uniref:Protein fam92a1 n=1 Tax=Plakobranchus ocellatus TaxID=259542 RepID=A0AAV3ZF61_9GAST|nr:protein fam92a1 [Plakobranchus ocellatus]